MGLPPLMVTFHPHPRVLVTPDDPPPLLTTPDEKIEILNDRFTGGIVFLKFDDAMRQMKAEDFIGKVMIEQLQMKALVVGYNHNLGHQRSGNVDSLAPLAMQFGFDLKVVEPVTYKNVPISSTRIRRTIHFNEWPDALEMLGHPYPIHGIVVKGPGRGRQLGWPTINLQWSERKLLPPEGVYACFAKVKGTLYKGMMFIGVTMFNKEQTLSVEANLFDFDADCYGEEVTLYVNRFVRHNLHFDTSEKLSQQIAKDKENIMKLIE